VHAYICVHVSNMQAQWGKDPSCLSFRCLKEVHGKSSHANSHVRWFNRMTFQGPVPSLKCKWIWTTRHGNQPQGILNSAAMKLQDITNSMAQSFLSS